MRYFGGKQRVAKSLCKFLNSQLKEGQVFIDLFCGSCNVISGIRQDVIRYANDKHPYIATMFSELQNGLLLPNEVTEEQYKYYKALNPITREQEALKCFVGFGLSFAGKWYKGYARGGDGRNYCANAKESTMRKLEKMMDVKFSCYDYKSHSEINDSVVYCDIPYKNATQYNAVKGFDHEEFYAWAKGQKKSRVLVSEYKHNVPEGAKVLWEMGSTKDIRDGANNRQPTKEVVFEFVN